MRTLALLVLPVMALGVAAAPAAAQAPQLTSELRMKPQKAGAKAKSVGIELSGAFRVKVDPATEPPIVSSVRVYLPRGVRYNGGRYPRCSRDPRSVEGDVRASCPKRSIVGSGSGTALVWGDVASRVEISYVNGGARRLWAYTAFHNPAFVQEPVRIDVEAPRRGRWGLIFDLAKVSTVLRITGPQMSLADYRFELGGRAGAPKYLTTSRSCPKRGFMAYRMSASYEHPSDGSTGELVDRGRLACK